MTIDTTSKGAAFEKQVVSLLRLMGYQLLHNELIAGTQCDIVAHKPDTFNNLRIIVECGDHSRNVGIDVIKEKSGILLATQTDKEFLYKLMYVSREGFTAEAKKFADSHPNVSLITIAQLESNIVNFSPYQDWYVHNFENSQGIFKEGNLIDNYVELSASDHKGKFVHSLSHEFHKWLDHSTSNILFLLGEYGSGKTSFARYHTYQMIKDESTKLPILINLRENRDAFNLRQIITDNLINHYGVALSNFQAFERFASLGRILMVLDGFDEMVEKSDQLTIINSFKQIFILSNLNTKILLTCRTNFFNKHSDVIDLFRKFSISLKDTQIEPNKVVNLDFEKQGKILFVKKLSDKQIKEYIEKRFGKQTNKILQKIHSIHDLTDLSSRPVLLEMILRSLPELNKENRTINSASLYEHYTNKWSNRDEWRTRLPLEFRQEFCENLSWLLFNQDKSSMSYDELSQIIDTVTSEMSKKEDERLAFNNDIKTCSFLVRTGATDEFRFAHKSFLEFFVAKKIAADLSVNRKLVDVPSPKGKEESKKMNELLSYEFEGASDVTMFTSKIENQPRNYYELESYYSELISKISKQDLSSNIYSPKRMMFSVTGTPVMRIESELYSPKSLESHISDRIEVSLENGHKKVHNLISEEIATFTMEILVNENIDLENLIKTVKEKDERELIFELIRKSKSTNLTRIHFHGLKKSKAKYKHRLLTSLAINLLNDKDFFETEVFSTIINRLSGDYLALVLLELADQEINYKSILLQLINSANLDFFAKLICFYGLRFTFKENNLLDDLKALLIDIDSIQKNDHIEFALAIVENAKPQFNQGKNFLLWVAHDPELSESARERAIRIACGLISKNGLKELKSLKHLISWQRGKKIVDQRLINQLDSHSKELNQYSDMAKFKQSLWSKK